MAATMKFICVVFLCSLIAGGNCQPCSVDNLTIKQAKTGKTVQNKPEWSITITNDCSCSQLDVKLSCNGFQTVEKIDPSILSKSGGECLINNGQPVHPRAGFSFTYAWDTSFLFKPLSSQIACS